MRGLRADCFAFSIEATGRIVASSNPRTFHARDPTRQRPRPRQPRLARFLPLVLVRGLLGPAARRVRAAACHQRGPRGPGRRFRHTWPPGHGDHQLRARRRAGAQGLHRHELRHPPGRRAAHERRARCHAQRVQPLAGATGAFPADLDPAGRHRHRAGVRAEAIRAGGEARASASRRLPGRRRWLGPHSPGRASVHRAPRRRGTHRARGRAWPQALRPRGARQGHGERRGARCGRRAEADGHPGAESRRRGRMRRCSFSICLRRH